MAGKPYMASARRGAPPHIVSGPNADDGCDAPLQQRDVSFVGAPQNKKVERLCVQSEGSIYFSSLSRRGTGDAASGDAIAFEGGDGGGPWACTVWHPPTHRLGHLESHS